MTTVQELLIDIFVAASAISWRQLSRDYKAVMILLLLAGCRLVTIQAVHAFLSVHAHLIFVHHGILGFRVALCALAGGSHKLGCGLSSLYGWPGTIDEKGSNNQGKRNNNRNENRAESHEAPLLVAMRGSYAVENTLECGALQEIFRVGRVLN